MKYLLYSLVKSRRFGVILFIFAFMWMITLLNMSLLSDPVQRSENMKEEILRLSEQYVRQLAKETQHTIDGPFAGRLTGYDLKKTLAVLLEDQMNRVERLEKLMSSIDSGQSLVDPGYQEFFNNDGVAPAETAKLSQGVVHKPINARDLLLGAQEECGITEEELLQYPHCNIKMGWMRNFWKTDGCYAKNGVDGSNCSIRVYLSEVEYWCPMLPARIQLFQNSSKADINVVRPKMKYDLSGLLELLKDPGYRGNYQWIRERITRLWPNWVTAGHALEKKQDMAQRKKKKILIHLGLLSEKSGFHIAENSQRGGPLGELVQWSDIISTLYILGHDLTIISEVEELTSVLSHIPSANAECQTRQNLPVDMIFSDIVGVTQLKRRVQKGFGKFSCLLRVIDTFGTEPAFNYESYARGHGLKTAWGMLNLNPQQFYTMFPHSPDNSFMGFVVDHYLDNVSADVMKEKKDQAVVYGKAEYMWQGKSRYLEVISKYVSVHGTVYTEQADRSSAVVPSFVTNHGLLKGPELQQLLRESKLFIGMGFPYEGPAPLEAIAQGCVYINPQFNPAHNRENTNFFKGKPTHRQVTSQHPYAAEFIGEPHVFSVTMDNVAEVDSVIQAALKAVNEGKVKPFMPYEYTEEGMLQRVNAYLEHQDFCKASMMGERWPLNTTAVVGEAGVSCKNACRAKGLICEPSHFKYLNTLNAVRQNAPSKCDSFSKAEDIVYPAYSVTEDKCVLQEQLMLFSCVGEHSALRRLCPCRTFTPGQMALCADCS